VTAAICATVTLGLAGCTAGQPAEVPTTPIGSSSPTSSAPTGQLPLDRTSKPSGPFVPWRLIRIDPADNRIYFSARSDDTCVRPTRAHIDESKHEVVLTIEGTRDKAPCSAEALTFVGYVSVSNDLESKRVLHGPSD
jgi:hypothetical protein